jgi:hypothetical protein
VNDDRRRLQDGLAPLVARLRRQRRLVDALQVATAAAIGAAIGAALARVVGPDPFLSPAGATLAAAVAVVARVLTHRRAPIDLLTAARRAERDPRWRERLSTALEHGDGQGEVASALRRDAGDRVADLDLEASAPTRVPWRWVGGLAGTLAVLAATLALPASSTGPVPTTDAAADAPPAPSAAAVADLAEEVAGSARRSRDALLAALADDLRELAEAAGPDGFDEADLARLDETLEAIAGASGGAFDAADLRGRLAERDAELRAEAAGQDGSLTDGDRDTTAPPPSLGVSGSGPTPDFGDVFTERREGSDGDESDRASGGGGDAPADLSGGFEIADLDDPGEASSFDGAGPQGGEADVIGAADDAGAGDSRLAGRGSQALEGEAERVDLTGSDTEAVGLAGEQRDDGRRIEIELPPDAAWEGYDPTAFAVGAWRATPEAAVDTDPTPLRFRAAAGAYFLPSQETASASR